MFPPHSATVSLFVITFIQKNFKMNRMMLAAFLSTLFLSCSNPPQDKKEEQPSPQAPPTPVFENFEKGKVLNPVFVKGDSSKSYALFIPTSYSTDKKSPVVYFFDPHAGGHIPIDKYRDIAERYGYIIIGSNNTENGMKMEITNQVIRQVMSDAGARMNIDPQRIYTCGFSGGSRVASNFAITNGGVNAVVACGAGLGTKQQPRQKFGFIGVAGNEDFNYTELKALDKQLSGTDWSHFFLEFNGKHEWPPVETMEEAFLWLQLNAIHDGLATKNDTLLKKFTEKNLTALKDAQKKKDAYAQFLACKKLDDFEGYLGDTSYHAELKKLETSKELQNVLQHRSQLETKEDSLKQVYAQALQSQNDAWWDTQVKKLNTEMKTMKDKDEVLLRKRIMSYLSLAAYMSASGALKFKDYKAADHFLNIYEAVDPENAEHAYLRSVIAVKQNEPDKAMEYLRKSVKLGFSDVKRLMSEADLVALSGKYPDFRELLVKVQQNAEKEK